MFGRLGTYAVRYRWQVITTWILLVVAGVFVMPSVTDFSMSTGFLGPGVESVNARLLMGEKFPEQQGAASTANIVIYNETGLTAEDEAYASRVAGSVQGIEDPGNKILYVMNVFDEPELRPSLVSADNTAMLIPVGVGTEAFDSNTGDTVDGIRESIPVPPAGTAVFVSGDAGLGGDHLTACIDALGATALVTLALITIILLAVYRSPIAPLVPLFTIGVSILVGLGIIGLLMRAGLEFSSFLQTFMVLIVFGAGTDYCLFMVSRYREELAKGVSSHQAVVGMMDRVGVVIASSGAVVIGGFAVIGFANFEMFRTIGPGLAIAVTVTLLAGLTFTPALMSTVKPSLLFWPAREFGVATAGPGSEPRVWARLGRWVGRAPVTVFGVGMLILILPLIGLPSLNRTFEIDKDLSDSYESVQGHQVVAERFDLSEMMPLNVIVSSPVSLSSGPGMEGITGLSTSLAGLDGVTQVRSATQPEGEPLLLEPGAMAQDPAIQAILPYYISEDGSTTRLMVGLDSSSYSNETYDRVDRVRDQAQLWQSESAAEGTTVLVGGASAEIADLISAMDSDTPRVITLVSVVTLIILALLLRSLIAPLYILASIYLTVLTTLAVTGLIFQGILDFRYDGVDWTVPLMLFILLVVLAADYSIFLMSRVKEEAETHGLREGVERGVTHTGGVITACGLILAGTFAALMVTSVGSLIQMGFAIAFGVLLDTFVVRPLLLPAVTLLLGRWAWWPGALSRVSHSVAPD